ncbi:MAG: hypothetical protein ABI852_16420 [Gemmatimonadaceae bacterium]
MAIGILAALAACSEKTPGEPGEVAGTPGLRVISGGGQSDTIDAVFAQPLVVEVRDDNGFLAKNVVVRLEVQQTPDPVRIGNSLLLCGSTAPTACSGFAYPAVATTTDSTGRVQMKVAGSNISGRAVVLVYAPTIGKPDSAVFQVRPGNLARIRASAVDTALTIGTPATLRGALTDRYGNLRTELPTLSAGTGTAFTVDATTGVLTPRELGAQYLFVRQGTLVDSTRVRVLPAGRIVVWAGDGSIRLTNLDGTRVRVLAQNMNSSISVFPNFDATRQRVTWQSGFNSLPFPVNTITIVDTIGTPRRDIDPNTSGFTQILSTRQMADGTLLVFGVRNGQTGLYGVSTTDVITLIRLVPATLLATGVADISHDGTRVALVGFDRNTQTIAMHVMVAATGNVTALDSAAGSPRWSAQDDRIAYLSGPVNGAGLRTTVAIIDANGQNKRTIATRVFDQGIAWSPDGIYLLARYTDSESGGTLNVYRISDGAMLPLVLPNVPSPRQPDWR